MILLNLETTNKQEEIIKNYLQENASEVLADKINNGVNITKDNKTLINKKTLKGFMKYACDEAHKQAENGATSAMIEDSVVYGWAIHYFEEDSIEGDLYNPDGSKYEPPKPVYKPSIPSPPKPIKQENKQPSLLDMIEKTNASKQEEVEPETKESEEWSEDEITDAMNKINEEEKRKELSIDEICNNLNKAIAEKNKTTVSKDTTSLYSKYLKFEQKYPYSIVAFRVGDFYEIFGDNAKLISDEIDLTLTSRDFGLAERIPMVGFPYHASEIYISKIVGKGHQVAIIEKDNEFLKGPTAKVDMKTGEVIEDNKELVDIIYSQLGNIFEVKL